MPLPRGQHGAATTACSASTTSTPTPNLMFPGHRRRAARRSLKRRRTAQVEVEMAAHGGSVIEIAQRGRQLERRCRTAAINRRITAQHADARSPARPPATTALKTTRRSRPARGARHAQQLRRRHDAVGHRADLRGELQQLLRRRRGRAPPDAAHYKRYGIAGAAGYAWGRHHRPLRRRQGAERAQPLRLGGRDRSLRSATRRR